MIDTAVAAARLRARRGDTLQKLWAVIKRDSRLAVSYDATFWMNWIGILVNIGVVFLIGSLVPPSTKFGLDGKPHAYFGYLVTNVAFLRFQNAAVQAFATAIRDGQAMGTLEFVLSTPTGLPFIVLSSGAYAFALALVQSLVMLAIAVPLGLDVSHANLLSFVIFLLLMIVAIMPIGVIASCATIAFKKTGPVEFALTSLTLLFGGVYIPVHSLPGLLQPISLFIPVTHAFTGLRGALEGLTVQQLWPEAAWLCALSAVLIPLSLLLFSAAVDRAKVDGTLGQY